MLKLSEILELDNTQDQEGEHHPDNRPDPEEVSMVLANLAQIASYAQQCRSMVEGKPNVEEWVQEKVAVCAHEIETILGYLKFSPEERAKRSED